jgi:hypothetical protein
MCRHKGTVQFILCIGVALGGSPLARAQELAPPTLGELSKKTEVTPTPNPDKPRSKGSVEISAVTPNEKPAPLIEQTPPPELVPLRQDLWRAGHAHAGVLLLLSLVALRYVDESALSTRSKWIVRTAIPSSAILLPAGFFLSVVSPDAKQPNQLIYLCYAGAAVLALGVVLLGIGLVRRPQIPPNVS